MGEEEERVKRTGRTASHKWELGKRVAGMMKEGGRKKKWEESEKNIKRLIFRSFS